MVYTTKTMPRVSKAKIVEQLEEEVHYESDSESESDSSIELKPSQVLPVKAKKILSVKQQESFAKARSVRATNLEKKKIDKQIQLDAADEIKMLRQQLEDVKLAKSGAKRDKLKTKIEKVVRSTIKSKPKAIQIDSDYESDDECADDEPVKRSRRRQPVHITINNDGNGNMKNSVSDKQRRAIAAHAMFV
jgi:hypothetical protein